MYRKIIYTLIFVFGFQGILTAQKEYTKRNKNEVREGPGSYYPLFYILPKGAAIKILEKKNGWIQFQIEQKELLKEFEKANDLSTWIAKNCLVEKKQSTTLQNLDGSRWESVKASRSSIAAAIRGFALRYGKASSTTLDSLIKLKDSLFTPQDYFRFKEESSAFLPASVPNDLVSRYTTYYTEYDIPLNEEGIGLGIASRVAANGLLNDMELLKYVNLLTTYLAEASGSYDIPFRTFILDDNDQKAFSIPGGFIFIAKGILNLCNDESEFAAIIAHEMMHIILEHGLKEIGQRSVKQKADMAFDELEREIGVEKDSTEIELEEFALEAYENVMKPRIQNYEEESDKGAILLLIQLGYDPNAVSRIILRIRDAVKSDEELEMENPFVHLDFKKRYDQTNQFIKEVAPGFKGEKNANRFRRFVKKY